MFCRQSSVKLSSSAYTPLDGFLNSVELNFQMLGLLTESLSKLLYSAGDFFSMPHSLK